MKHLSKTTQIDWWNKEVRHTQQNTQNHWHIRENKTTIEVLEPSNLSSQSTSLRNTEQMWLATSQERTDKMSVALDIVGIDELVMAQKIKEIMQSAYTSTPEWELIPDYKVMLDAVKLVYKMRSWKPDTQINIANIFWGKGWDL